MAGFRDGKETILKHLKRAVIISLFFLLGIASAEEDLIINADNVEYDKEKELIEASGNVVATYKDLRIDAAHIIYLTTERRILAPKAFTLVVEDQWIAGETLDYGIDTRRGSAKNVDMIFRGLYLKGRSIELDPEEISLDGASFTSCDADLPHYHISASALTLYPKNRWLAAYWGWFYLGPVPILPVPTYIYDLSPERRNTAPIPEIGSNDDDGTYVIERLAWHTSRQVYGRVNLTYASKKGPGGGVEGNYIANEWNSCNARIHTSQVDGWWGGLTYLRSFGDEVGRRGSDEFLYSLFNVPRNKKMEFELTLSSRERINFFRVSFLPDVALRVNEDYLFDNLKYSGELRGGRVLEESTTLEASRTALTCGLSYDFPISSSLSLIEGLDFVGKWYSEGSIWQKLTGHLGLRKRWSEFFESGLGYKPLLLHEGMSPFNFEKYRFRPSDEIYANSYFDVYGSRLGASVEYYVPSWDAKDIDYFVSTRLHCFDLTFTYRALRNEVQLGIGLVTQ